MRTHIPADALRVARTLTRLSQRDVAVQAGVVQKSLVAAEAGRATRIETHLRLRKHYERMGIEFMGTVDLAKDSVVGSGARWRMPDTLPPSENDALQFHTESAGVSFAAARALLGSAQKEIARLAGIPERKMASVELGKGFTSESYEALRQYYENAGVVFLGWGDVSRKVFYGVGVRWAANKKPLQHQP